MTTVEQLKKAGKFIVEEWTDVMRANGVACIGTGTKTHQYLFEYEEGHLWASEASETVAQKIVTDLYDPERTLADLAKEEFILWVRIVPIGDGLPFNLYNPRIRFLEQ